MNSTFLFFGMDMLSVGLLFMVLVFSIGVVWRTEKKLDLSYKFFVAAAASLTLAEVLSFSPEAETFSLALLGKMMRLLGSIFFLVSILLMRDIVRTLDGEKPGMH